MYVNDFLKNQIKYYEGLIQNHQAAKPSGSNYRKPLSSFKPKYNMNNTYNYPKYNNYSTNRFKYSKTEVTSNAQISTFKLSNCMSRDKYENQKLGAKNPYSIKKHPKSFAHTWRQPKPSSTQFKLRKDFKSRSKQISFKNENLKCVRINNQMYKVLSNSLYLAKKVTATAGKNEGLMSFKPSIFKHSSLLKSKIINKSKKALFLASRKKVNESCMFYNRYGRCHRKKCQYKHDPDKIAVCTRFLRGTCKSKLCSFSHKVCPNKMPVCTYFLKGKCSAKSCPYSHVRVNPSAPVCKQFLKGYCPLQEKCNMKHTLPKRENKTQYSFKSKNKEQSTSAKTKLDVGQDKEEPGTAAMKELVMREDNDEMDTFKKIKFTSPLPQFISLAHTKSLPLFRDLFQVEEDPCKLKIKPNFLL